MPSSTTTRSSGPAQPGSPGPGQATNGTGQTGSSTARTSRASRPAATIARGRKPSEPSWDSTSSDGVDLGPDPRPGPGQAAQQVVGGLERGGIVQPRVVEGAHAFSGASFLVSRASSISSTGMSSRTG